MPRMRKQSYEVRSQRAALRRKLETPEQRAIRLEKSRIRAANRRACETEEERAVRLARDRERVNSVRARLRQKAKAVEQQLLKQNETEASSRGNKASTDNISRNQLACYMLLRAQRDAAARRAAARRSNETCEQRAVRLEKCRVRAAFVRACESEETRAARLARQRIRTNAARSYLRIQARAAVQNSATAGEQNSGGHSNFELKRIYEHTAAANRARMKERLKTAYHKHIAYKAYSYLLAAQLRGVAPNWELGNLWPRCIPYNNYPIYHNNQFYPEPQTTGAVDSIKTGDLETCLSSETEIGSIYSRSSVNVECEVTIEEGNELQESKGFLQEELVNELPLKQEASDEEDEDIFKQAHSSANEKVSQLLDCTHQPLGECEENHRGFSPPGSREESAAINVTEDVATNTTPSTS